ncbi:MAG: hypothetical protein HY674_02340 [Chloroflexi bacterium]|nr:hypothetical protein [Chloroflexota bacterium]
MKTRPLLSIVIATLLATGGMALPTRAAITGQWDFDSGNLVATFGQDMSYLEGPGGDTEANTRFGTTTSFGIPGINGQEAKVMKFPKTVLGSGGFLIAHGASPNGRGFNVNQYTIIMDVLFPATSSDKVRSLLKTDWSFGFNADYLINNANGIGVEGGGFDGLIQANTWHRIAFAVDLAAASPVVDKFINGVKVGGQSLSGIDSRWSAASYLYFAFDNDANPESPSETEEGYINSIQFRDEKLSDGLLAALGGPNAQGILSGPPPNPYIDSVEPSPESARIPSRSNVPPQPTVRVVILDGMSKVVDGTIQLLFDGEVVTPQIAKDGTATTVSYTPPSLLQALSIHKVALTFRDDASPANELGTQYSFAIGAFSPITSDAMLPLGSADTPGFKVKTVQAQPFISQVANPTNLALTLSRGIQHINGTLRSIEGDLLADESIPGPNSDGGYSIPDMINFSTTFEVGNFMGDQPFPGIPGVNGHSTQFTTEVLTFLELEKGVHRFGMSVNVSRVDVNDDDGYTLFVDQNPRNVFSQVVGAFQNVTGGFPENAQNNNEFTFFAPETGLYPFRLLFYQGGREASLEWYSVDLESGAKILINDLSNPKAVKAFQNSTSPKAHLPYIAELSPRPGTLGNDAAAPLQILIDDDRTDLNTGSLELTFDGLRVTPSLTTYVPSTMITDRRTVVLYQPNVTRASVTNTVRLAYADSATPPNTITRDWSFTIAVKRGGSRTIVRGQWDFDKGNLDATVGQKLEYFDGAGGQTESKTQFGTTTSFGIPDIDGQPAKVMRVPGDLSNQIGYIMRHGITPNGGGTRVNQYTLIYDVLISSQGPGAASMIQIDDENNRNDGDLFWQGNNFGQGQGGYVGTGAFTPEAWHRVSIAVDLAASPPVITKYIDGIKQHDWSTDGLDGRRSLRNFAILFADGDQDERRVWYVNSVQIREGRMSDAELTLLGRPVAAGLPRELPSSSVTGQWDFEAGNLAATVGRALEYFDGAGGDTQNKTQFGTTTSFGIPDVNGQPANVMRVPGDLSNKIGYIMRHGISPNGGGTRVNQYTLIYDVMIGTTGPGAASMIQIDDLNNANDGDLFWQGNNFGQGQGGYVGTGLFTAGAWHRVAIAVDLSATPPVITKYLDGIKQHDWSTDGLDGRRSLRDFAILFADGDQDERRVWYVNSVQIREGRLSDAQLAALGGPSAAGLPLATPPTTVTGQWDFEAGNLAATAGQALEYFDGAGGETQTKTQFGSTSSFGVPGIDGQTVNVMQVPGDLNNKIGYIMRHGISPNGGGTRVNQYTLVYDVMIGTTGPGAASMIQIDDQNNANDGDLFWQGNNFGQGQGGYNGTGIFTPGAWHRVSLAVDLTTTPGTLTKYVDGVKQDDWRTDALDGRRSLRDFAILFADGDQDERRVWYVNSVQIRAGKLSDAQLTWLGKPSPAGIPIVVPEINVTGQWDFDRGNLAPTAGKALEYYDGAGGDTQTKTQFGTSTSFGIPGINSQEVNVMRVPGDLSNKIGYIMRHDIAPNGGGARVNLYTLILDVLIAPEGPGAASIIQIDDLNNANDGDLFWQGNNFGQGQGGYNGTGIFTPGSWHRIALAVDLTSTPGVLTKYVDGVKQDDWRTDALDGRRSLRDFAILFADGDQDERRVWYVNSVQIRSGKLSDNELARLGGPDAAGIPLLVPDAIVMPPAPIEISEIGIAGPSVTIKWTGGRGPFQLQKKVNLNDPWVDVGGTVDTGEATDTTATEATGFYRVRGQ